MTIEELVNNLDGVINQIMHIQNDVIEHLSSTDVSSSSLAVFCSNLSYSLGAAEITLADIETDVQNSGTIARSQGQEES